MYRNIIWPQVFCVLGCDNLIKYNFFMNVPAVSRIWIKNKKNIKVLKLDFETGQATRQSHIINATEVCNYMNKKTRRSCWQLYETVLWHNDAKILTMTC